ncbi:MAG: hypothetical protein HQL32_09845 [Planctomycetes bacterium]|nr:hypothetical protein [Planctomycetota bacterium]
MPGIAKNTNSNIEELIEENEYFYSLVKKANPKKKRRCLKCGIVFLSAHYGNRTCGSCAAQNSKAPNRAQQVY